MEIRLNPIPGVMTSIQRRFDVDMTSCAGWVFIELPTPVVFIELPTPVVFIEKIKLAQAEFYPIQIVPEIFGHWGGAVEVNILGFCEG